MITIINNSCILERKIKKILKCQYKFFLSKVNVVGVALGFKRQNNFYTHQKCIQVFVSRKLPKSNLCKNQLIPSYYKGVPTDVVQSGFFTAFSLNKRIRPVLGGYGISGATNMYSGTSGCLVTNGVSNFVLSTNHTIAGENEFPLGTPIIQPPREYGGFHPNDDIGILHKFIPLRFVEGTHRPVNLSDCALALLNKPNILSPEITYIGKLKGVKNPVLNEEVKKVGATTELTHGNILNTDGITTTTFASGKTSLFENLIFTTRMTERGDSGCILANKYNYGLGMGFAGADDLSIFCNLKIVLDQLDVHLVT